MKWGEMLKKKILLVTGALLLATFMATSLIMLVHNENVMLFIYNEVSVTPGGGTDAIKDFKMTMNIFSYVGNNLIFRTATAVGMSMYLETLGA
jgi:hypothetical protein